MIIELLTCLLAFSWLIWLVLKRRQSLGLPIAYLGGLLLIHVPGALAYIFSGDVLHYAGATSVGFRYASVAALCFVLGAWMVPTRKVRLAVHTRFERTYFCYFCLLGGWGFVYVLSPLHRIPSVGAVVDEAGALWMLGVMLGLREAISCKAHAKVLLWSGALLVYPVAMLLLGGFLSYGSAAAIIVGSGVLASARSYPRALLGVSLVAVVGLSLFVNYFSHRKAIRKEVWGGASLSDRLFSVGDMFLDFQLFNPADPVQAQSLDERLNQNYFVGLAAERIQNGDESYLRGRSIWQAMLALIPRAIWPSKPVAAGSGDIVREMTGLRLSTTTSWGVGNVMELQVNFGLPGVVLGFLLLGWIIGFLDRNAAVAVLCGDYGRSIVYFLPAVALIQPQGSMVELASGSAAALIAGTCWRWQWQRLRARKVAFTVPQPMPILAYGSTYIGSGLPGTGREPSNSGPGAPSI